MSNVPTMTEVRAASVFAIRHDICQWGLKIASDDRYGYVIWKSNVSSTHTCPICKGRKPGHDFGWNCIGLGAATWHHGGGIPSACNCGVIDNGLGTKMLKMSVSDILASAQKHFGIKEIKVIYNGGKHIPSSMLEPGDICLLYSGSTYKHLFTYIGNGKIVHATGSNGKVPKAKQITSAAYFKSGVKLAFRYTGTRSYISVGAKGDAVRKVQAIVGVTADGIFGEKTLAAVKKFQTSKGLVADGLVGAKTLAAMKKEPTPVKKRYSGEFPSLSVGKRNRYLRLNEKSNRVKLLQKYLNWYFGKTVCKVDGSFGQITEKYVKQFQTAQKIKADGIVGPTTLKKMKGVVK